MKKGNIYKGIALSAACLFLLSGCQATEKANDEMSDASKLKLSVRAVKNHRLNSVGMPDDWTNWGEIWENVESRYKLSHKDEDMTSSEELVAFTRNTNKKDAVDIGDVGVMYAMQAEQNGLTQKYKTSYWDEIPDWAKDDDGDWIVSYYGTTAMLINTDITGEAPTSFADVMKGDYKVAITKVDSSNQAEYAVLSAAIANKGSEENIQPGIDYFSKLADEGRLVETTDVVNEMSNNNIGVAFLWDYTALSYRDTLSGQGGNYTVNIPSDGAVREGYATIINANAGNAEGAALTREYILSDEGQTALAKGYATPVRDIELPESVLENRVPEEQYQNATWVENRDQWAQTLNTLGSKWNAIVEMKL